MTPTPPVSTSAAWARFRFSVVGALLSSPPARGALKAALRDLAQKTWAHPITGQQVQFARATIERWYYQARRAPNDPVAVLRRAVRKDRGKSTVPTALAERLAHQYREHPDWTYKLHYDNLAALVKAEPNLGPLGSYHTLRRYMQAHGQVRRPAPRAMRYPGEVLAQERRQAREVKSYETEYVGSLWHLDFHHGSLEVLTPDGRWLRPLALGILDDHSRLCCHLQWYLTETAEDLVHGLSQAIQKRGRPRALMTDNGAAMVAEEVTEGLERLGIHHERTLPYSPYQNGKQETFWGTLEGRLMKMLSGVADLTLDFLNEATQAWVELGYNDADHRELEGSPSKRFLHAPDVLRESPSSEALRDAFRLETRRTQRRSDGTISLEGVRFELPARYRQFKEVAVRYARWDLGRVDLVDALHGTILAPIYPLDKTANADAHRAPVTPDPGGAPAADDRATGELPPLLKQILEEYSATGLPPAYLPKTPRTQTGDAS
jgi:putative transposase